MAEHISTAELASIRKLLDEHCRGASPAQTMALLNEVERLLAEAADARRAALEEAAKLLEVRATKSRTECATWDLDAPYYREARVLDSLAAEVRALLDAAPKETT